MQMHFVRYGINYEYNAVCLWWGSVGLSAWVLVVPSYKMNSHIDPS